jgi:hypothetical protein
MDIKLRLKQGLEISQIAALPTQEVAQLCRDALARIEELEKEKDLLKRGSREAVLEIARQRGTITALREANDPQSD